jgi:glycerol kinase
MSERLILGIDQGTTNTKAIAVTAGGDIVAEASVHVPLAFPRPGWVESEPHALWRSVEQATSACLDQIPGSQPVAVGLANQRESVVMWDRRTGEPLGPCVSWQCRRSAPLCEELNRQGHDAWVRERTGLAIDPMFSAGKARWLLDQAKDGRARARGGEVCIGTVDSWILWNLTGGEVFATDHTNASRTQLFALRQLGWDPELLDLFGVPAVALPHIRPSSAVYGPARGLGTRAAGAQVAALAGDSHAALFGHGPPPLGAVKATFGTGTSVMVPTADLHSVPSLSTTIAWSLTSRRGGREAEAVNALEGNIVATGAALEWLAAILGLEGREEELAVMAAEVPNGEGAYLVPAFAGLGAPHWQAEARGLITGLTRGTTRRHLARAAFESIAYQVRDVVDVLRFALPSGVQALYADGGAVRSELLGQLLADTLRVPVLRTRTHHLAALGAAYLAGLAVGVWSSIDGLRALPRGYDRFMPSDEAPHLEAGYQGWREAVQRAIAQFDPDLRPVALGAS